MSDEKEYNAIAQANTPNFNYLWNNFPHAVLEASGSAVGLPEGQISGSETGHLNIGAGKDYPSRPGKINKSIEDNMLEKNPTLVRAFEKVKKYNSTLHIKGLVSPGGVHSSSDHLYALINLAKRRARQESSFTLLPTDGTLRPKAPRNILKNWKSFAKIPA